MNTGKVLVCVGTCPEIIKVAPLYHALRRLPGLEVSLLYSGQHDDLARHLYRFFDIEPDHRIQLSRKSQSLGHLFALLMDRFEDQFRSIAPGTIDALIDDPKYYSSFKSAQNPFGDGHSAERIAGIIRQTLVI